MQSQESGAVEVGVVVGVEGGQPSCLLQNHNQMVLASGVTSVEKGKFYKLCTC